jgi:hypothetical protein
MDHTGLWIADQLRGPRHGDGGMTAAKRRDPHSKRLRMRQGIDELLGAIEIEVVIGCHAINLAIPQAPASVIFEESSP